MSFSLANMTGDRTRESSVARTRKILITQTDKYADLMSKMSKTAPEPAQDKGSGHQKAIFFGASPYRVMQFFYIFLSDP